ncbi:MAG: TM1802 family CRISPR-associated protein [Candidatus Parvarchaeota archaeon]
MLKSIALIGSQGEGEWAYLVDSSSVRDVFVICTDDNGKYKGVTVEDNAGEERYLYRRDKSGKPGIFLTGRIPANDIKFIKKQISGQKEFDELLKEEKVESFVKKKIGWYSFRKTILDNSDAMVKVPESSRQLLATALDEVTANKYNITKELFRLISQGNYNSDAFITIKFGARYSSEIDGFPSIFKYLSQVGRPSKKGVKKSDSSVARCVICNSPAPNRLLKEPLQFVTFDKPNFAPDGKKENSAKALSICDKCYEHLQRGERYIRDNFDFDIPNTKGATKVSFWLIPVLNNWELVKMFMKTQEKGLSSFRNMWKIADDIEAVKKADLTEDIWSDSEPLSAFLTYSALFYRKDKYGHMMPVEMADGIFSPRLAELARKKFEVDRISGYKTLFHYGILQEFLFSDNKKDPGKMDDFRTLSHIMSSIFTAKKLDRSMITKMVVDKIRQKARKQDSEGVKEITLKATALLEYLHRVGCLEGNPLAEQAVGPNSDPLYQDVALFMGSHSRLLNTKNLRAICAIGIAAGVVIKAQKAHLGSETFMARLNRFEVDYARLKSIFPAAMPKLQYYKATQFLDLFASLGAYEVVNLDPSEKVDKETMNLVLAIGVCKGFELFESKKS